MDKFVANTDFSIKGKNISIGTILTEENSGLYPVDFALLIRLGRISELEVTDDYYGTVDSFTIGTRTAIAPNEAFVLTEVQPDIEQKIRTTRTRRKKTTEPVIVKTEPDIPPTTESSVGDKYEVSSLPEVEENTVSEVTEETNIENTSTEVVDTEEPKDIEEVSTETEETENSDVIVPKKRRKKKDHKSE